MTQPLHSSASDSQPSANVLQDLLSSAIRRRFILVLMCRPKMEIVLLNCKNEELEKTPGRHKSEELCGFHFLSEIAFSR